MNEEFFHALPKVELHCHLLGTIQRTTLTDWVQREGLEISAAEIEAFYTRGDKPVGVLKVLRLLERQLLRSPDDLYRMTVEYLAAAHAHNIRHTEFFWNPTGPRVMPAFATATACRRSCAACRTPNTTSVSAAF